MRAAIQEANAAPNVNDIWFGMPLSQADALGRYLIDTTATTSGLPVHRHPTGDHRRTTQPGFDSTDHEPIVVVRKVGGTVQCALCITGPDVTVRGLVIFGVAHGIR